MCSGRCVRLELRSSSTWPAPAKPENASVSGQFKAKPTGNVIAELRARTDSDPPEVRMDCEVPDWLTNVECLATAVR